MAAPTRDKRRAILHEEIRLKIAAGNHHTHAVKIIGELEELGRRDEGVAIQSNRIGALKAALDGRLRLLDKCIPTLKAIELQGAVAALSHEQWLQEIERQS